MHGNTRSGTKGEQAYRMRSQGLGWPEIARRLGWANNKRAMEYAHTWAEHRGERWPVRVEART